MKQFASLMFATRDLPICKMSIRKHAYMFTKGATEYRNVILHSIVLGGCPLHGRVERDEIPTRESPPKQSGTR